MKTKTEELYAKAVPWRLFFIVALPGMISTQMVRIGTYM